MNNILHQNQVAIPAALSRCPEYQSIAGSGAEDREHAEPSSAARIAPLTRFIRRVVAPGGFYGVAIKPAGGMRQQFFRNADEAARFAIDQDKPGNDVYFACASFGSAAGGRKGENVVALGALWLDIDCGPDKPYPDPDAGRAALDRYIEAVGLPAPLIVSSGHGLHVYWPLSRPVTPDEWQPLANLLKASVERHDLKADHARTTDRASLLRPVGCANRKQRPELQVQVLQDSDATIDPNDGADLLGASAETADTGAASECGLGHGPAPAHLQGIAVNNSDLGDPAAGHWVDRLSPEDRDRFLEAFVERPQIQAIAHGTRDEWLQTMAAIRALDAPNGRAIAKQWSRGAPQKFNERAFDHAWGRGPRDRITVGSLIHRARGAGLDLDPWRRLAGEEDAEDEGAGAAAARAASAMAAPDDLDRFDIQVGWGATPPRDWLIGKLVLRAEVTVISAPGGTGKSAFALGLAAAAASGRDLLGHNAPQRLRVVVINAEDSRDELMRRVTGAAQHHNIKLPDLADRLALIGAGDLGRLELNRITPRSRQGEVADAGIELLESVVRGRRADLLILDPLVALCPAGLNDNALAAATISAIKQMAQRAQCGVMILHHTRKGAGRGDQVTAEDASGAAAITNLARVAMSLSNPSGDDASDLGVLPSDRWRIVELTNTKANLAPLAARDRYWLESVTLANGDNVQVIAPFVLNVGQSRIPNAAWRDVLVAIAAGDNGPEPKHHGEALSPAKRTGIYRAAPVIAQALQRHLQNERMSDLVAMAPSVIGDATAKGWLTTAKFQKPGGRPRDGLVVVWSATPWAAEPPPEGHIQ